MSLCAIPREALDDMHIFPIMFALQQYARTSDTDLTSLDYHCHLVVCTDEPAYCHDASVKAPPMGDLVM